MKKELFFIVFSKSNILILKGGKKSHLSLASPLKGAFQMCAENFFPHLFRGFRMRRKNSFFQLPSSSELFIYAASFLFDVFLKEL